MRGLTFPPVSQSLELGEDQLRWYEGDRSRFKGIGKDLQDAITFRENQVATLEALRAAAAAGRELVCGISRATRHPSARHPISQL